MHIVYMYIMNILYTIYYILYIFQMKYLLLYQLNNDINTRSYYEEETKQLIFENMIKLYTSKIGLEKEEAESKEVKDKPFIDINDFFIFYYSIFDIMLLIRIENQSLPAQDKFMSINCEDNEVFFETYGKDSILKMFLEYIDELCNGDFSKIIC